MFASLSGIIGKSQDEVVTPQPHFYCSARRWRLKSHQGKDVLL